MKKAHILTLFGIFAIASFIAVNMYTSTSFPGFSSSADCNMCHNSPSFIKNTEVSISVNDRNAYTVFESNRQYARNYVPAVQTNNRSLDNTEFIQITFLKNSTHIMVYTRISDSTLGSNSSKSTSDKFSILWNIDSANFSVGNFIDNYNSSAPLDDVVTGQMALDDGHADMWYVDSAVHPINASSKASDMYISSNYLTDGTTKQDVDLGYYYFGGRYYIYFVRTLTTDDSNDVQFEKDGTAILYALALWDNDRMTYHLSSFDNMVIIGDYSVGMGFGTTTITTTQKETVTASGTISASTSSFTLVFVLAGLAVGIPVIANIRRRKS
jgi:hypothetical protein